jgi:hypothetical protein
VNDLKDMGYLMSRERAEAFAELAKAVFNFLDGLVDYGLTSQEVAIRDAYTNLMEIIAKESDGEHRVQPTVSEVKEQG